MLLDFGKVDAPNPNHNHLHIIELNFTGMQIAEALTLSCDHSHMPMCMYLTMQATPGDKVVSSFGRLTDTGNAGTHSSSHIQGICAWLARLDFQEFLSVHLSFVVTLSTHQVPLETEDRCVIATYSLLPAYLHTHSLFQPSFFSLPRNRADSEGWQF